MNTDRWLKNLVWLLYKHFSSFFVTLLTYVFLRVFSTLSWLSIVNPGEPHIPRMAECLSFVFSFAFFHAQSQHFSLSLSLERHLHFSRQRKWIDNYLKKNYVCNTSRKCSGHIGGYSIYFCFKTQSRDTLARFAFFPFCYFILLHDTIVHSHLANTHVNTIWHFIFSNAVFFSLLLAKTTNGFWKATCF